MEFENFPIRHSTKPNELLVLLAKKLQQDEPFASIYLTIKDAYLLKMDGYNELFEWVKVLKSKKHIYSDKLQEQEIHPESSYEEYFTKIPFYITPEGWSQAESLGNNSFKKCIHSYVIHL